LSGVGKLRALCEPFVSRPEFPPEDESIQSFLERRLGAEMSRRIASPLLSGVFAGDANRLSVHAAFPQIPRYELDHGSLFWGMKAARKVDIATFRAKLKVLVSALLDAGQPVASPFYSLRGGMASLIERLREVCQAPSERGSVKLHLGSPVKRLLLDRNRALGVGLRSGGEVRAARVVLAGPPWAAADVIGLGHPELRKVLLKLRGAPTATVFFGLNLAQMDRPLSGSGFIVPPGEGAILASTFTHQKWEGRAPAGTALLRAFVGGARSVGPSPLDASDEQLTHVSQSELERFLGPMGTPLFSRVYRYSRGTPQPEVGHFAWLRRVRALTAELSGISMIGPGYDGVGIPDCIRAARVLAESFSGPEPPAAWG
jgi:protoporphyrinogen/coproporphyrinogen III oxidase